MLLAGFCSTSLAASPVGKDGTIHACYKVKGKPKGTLRVVGVKKHCKRGERKVVWNAAGQGGQGGTAGQPGSNGSGQPGTAGSNGSSSANEAVLKTEIASLEVKIGSLEGILKGVSNGDLLGSLATVKGLNNADLLGAVDAVKGLNNADLTEAVNSLPVVDSLCTQATGLTEQSNLLGEGISKISLGGVLPVGLTLKLPTLEPLEPFAC